MRGAPGRGFATGRAYHKRIVEGREAFEAIYASELDRAEFPDAIDTVKEITARLAEVGGPTKGLSKFNKPELMAKLWEFDPDVLIWDDLVAKHRCQHQGRILLAEQHALGQPAFQKRHHIDLFRTAAAYFRNSPDDQMRKALQDVAIQYLGRDQAQGAHQSAARSNLLTATGVSCAAVQSESPDGVF